MGRTGKIAGHPDGGVARINLGAMNIAAALRHLCDGALIFATASSSAATSLSLSSSGAGLSRRRMAG